MAIDTSIETNQGSEGGICAQQDVEEAGWIQVGRQSPASTEAKVHTEVINPPDKPDGGEEEERNPFKIPEQPSAWPLWFLSLPWNALFTVTVPNCKKVELIKV